MNYKHGGFGEPEYRIWANMRARCRSGHADSGLYFERGISVCSRWDDYPNFLTDMGRRPTPKHTIDRINSNGGYEPSNCRWATQTEQQNNRRNNRVVEYAGMKLTIAQWSRMLDVPRGFLFYHLTKMGRTMDNVIDKLTLERCP